MDTKTKNPIFRTIEQLSYHPLISYLAVSAGPIIMYALVEYLNNNRPFSYFSPVQIVLNLIWYYMMFFIVYLIIGRLKLSAGISSVLFYIFGTANHYVYAFRGRIIFPGDFLTLKTAANVASGYSYIPDRIQILTFLLLLGYLFLLSILPRQKGRKTPDIKITASACILCIAYTAVFFGTSFLANMGIKPSMWTTRGNGFILNFTIALRYSSQDEPDGYSQDELEVLSDEYRGVMAQEDTPVNLIVVMNEAFSDLGVLGDFETNEDWMPYYRSLRENCQKGNAFASVFGGTTANSEYEFLTGNTMAFLPEGVVPFQMYINEDAASLPRQMKALGYRTVAMHPYLPSGWNRIPVYENFRFDTVMFKDDFKNKQYMRNYVTDQSNYENVISIFEEKEPGEKLFIFNVTMQNHSSYTVENKGLPDTVRLTGVTEGVFPSVDQYLSLMKQSDLALEYLIDYFSKVDEKTAILIFGDHQPQVARSFFTTMLGGNLEDLPVSSMQLRQITPFCLWTNYDQEEKEGLEYSLNYLSAFMLESLGFPLTGYQEFLLEASESLPVINTLGYKDKNGVYYELGTELSAEYQELLSRYEILQHSELFDQKSRVDEFFLIPER